MSTPSKIILFTWFFLASFGGFCQSNQSVDLISDTKGLRTAINKLVDQAKNTSTIEPDLLDGILKTSLKLKDTLSFFHLSKSICRYYYVQNDLNHEGIVFIMECQKLLNGKESSDAEYDNVLGNFYKRLHFQTKALEHYFKSVSWYEKYDPINVTIPMGNIAGVYFENDNFDKSLHYNEIALSYSLKLTDTNSRLSNLAIDYSRIGEIYSKKGMQSKASSYFEKSLNASREYDPNSLLMLFSIAKALQFYNDTGVDRICKNLIWEGDDIYKENKIHQSIEATFYVLARSKYYLKIGRTDKLIEPEEIKEMCSVLAKENYLYAIDFYTHKKDVKKTIEYYDKLLDLNEVKTVESRTIAYSLIEEEFIHQKLECQNKMLTQDLATRKKTIAIILSTLILISSLLCLQYYNNHRHKRLNNLLNIEKGNLEKTNKELERFAFIASHDLKTPLHNILNFTELLEQHLDLVKDQSAKLYLKFIKEGGLRLENLIKDTLEYSEFSKDSIRLEDEQINLNELLAELEFSMKSSDKNRIFEIVKSNDLPIVLNHPYSVYTLFEKLIENSIHYNKNEVPTIQIEAIEEGEFYSILIKDNGIGIDEEHNEEIFTMFYRLHNHQKYTGTGLGLSICKKIAQRIGGEILLVESCSQGSTFKIMLPRYESEQQGLTNKTYLRQTT